LTVITREAEGEDPEAVFSWDTTWTQWDYLSSVGGSGGYGDWLVADAEEVTTNRGGFQSRDQLTTAIIQCLFTDKRKPDELEVNNESDDPRGWHGDSYDVDIDAGERELGSYLWTLQRDGPVPVDVKRVEHYASEALQTLVDQGAVDHFEITAEVAPIEGRISFLVNAFAKNGASLFAGTFPLQ
jgi:phage gp46-like protein